MPGEPPHHIAQERHRFSQARASWPASTEASKELLAAALALPLDQRAALARELIASLDGPADEDADQAWGEEIERRIAGGRD